MIALCNVQILDVLLRSDGSVGKESACKCRRPQFDSWVRNICWRRERLPTPVFLGFPGGSAGKNLPVMRETQVGSLDWEAPLEKGKASHSSILAWRIPWTSPRGREELDTIERLHFPALEKEMATYSSVLAWRIPGTVEPGGLPSMGSHRVGYD